ncbi:MAG TPA: A/G-specific adenine glycosylase [Ferruginibacter sp.]|nr:A/G-specific adenine glycosylase [Ferruginibacter sp.]
MISHKKYFSSHLLLWNKKNNTRQMPWKGETDPYKIWLSEIILQQTRVEQGWDYYNRFLKVFPTIEKLALAPEQKIFKLWEGLGYYTRCKNLIATAKFITHNNGGIFPGSYDEILALKGIGPYTAAAIASFAFNLPYAVLDGNVFRVLARFFAIRLPIDNNAAKKYFATLANELLDKKNPGVYNQAIMDFGAVICKPQNPLCKICSLKNKCKSLTDGLINQIPVKEKRIVKKDRWLYYFLVVYNNKVYVRKRATNDIWQNLYEFILTEVKKEKSSNDLKPQKLIKTLPGNNVYSNIIISKKYKQQLTHQNIYGRFILINAQKPLNITGYEPVSFKHLKKMAFPKIITVYLAEQGIVL